MFFKYYMIYKINLSTYFNNFNIKVNFYVEYLNLYKIIR